MVPPILQRLSHRLKQLPISQQLALAAAGCCLTVSLLLVAVAARSQQFVQEALLIEYGEAVAQQLARRLAVELATGDRLSVSAELAEIVELAAISGASAEGIDGSAFADAGQVTPTDLHVSAPILIDSNIAGRVTVAVATHRQAQARRQSLLALSGLAAMLSLLIYSAVRPLGQRTADKIKSISKRLEDVVEDAELPGNELTALIGQIDSLPLDLLRPTIVKGHETAHYTDTAVLFIALKSLPDYVDTLDSPRLKRYVALLHRLAYGAAGFYQGKLEVVRQFGLAVYFNGEHKIGSPATRAVSCAWLLQQAVPAAEGLIRLSIRQGLAVGLSELGQGDSRDIYPGLYTQATLDELAKLAGSNEDALLLNRAAARDINLATRVKISAHGKDSWRVNDLADGHRDLLERQLELMLKAILSRAKDEEPRNGTRGDLQRIEQRGRNPA